MLSVRERTACFSGHRVIPSDRRDRVVALLLSAVSALIEEGFTDFICGGALGFDTLAANAVIAARAQNAGVRLILALPCKNQTRNWNRADVLAYEALLAAADEVHCLSEAYTHGCMQRRNRFMVDHSAAVVTYCGQASGGTAYTIAYAAQEGIRRIPLFQLVHSEMD